MVSYIRILALCTIAGFLLAAVFITPAAASAGAVKGFLLGAFITWGEWNSRRKEAKARCAAD